MKLFHLAALTVAVGLAGTAAVVGPSACVPSGSAPPYDAGAQPAATSTVRPSLNVMTSVFEDNFDRPDSGEGTPWAGFEGGAPGTPSASALGPLERAGRDGGGQEGEGGLANLRMLGDGGGEAGSAASVASGASAASALAEGGADAGERMADRSNLGPNWVQARTNAWRIENGKLCVQGAHNHGVWLNRTLPINARIEFDATAFTDEGDLKTEVWGDGVSFATGTSYTNATSYLAILGGWKNTLHVLARQNEHGTDRKEIKVDKDSDDPTQRPVQKGQTYHFKVERKDGKTVHWSVDGVDFLSFVDAAPLAGQGHDHFGFNEWEAKVCFDNVKVTPL